MVAASIGIVPAVEATAHERVVVVSGAALQKEVILAGFQRALAVAEGEPQQRQQETPSK